MSATDTTDDGRSFTSSCSGAYHASMSASGSDHDAEPVRKKGRSIRILFISSQTHTVGHEYLERALHMRSALSVSVT